MVTLVILYAMLVRLFGGSHRKVYAVYLFWVKLTHFTLNIKMEVEGDVPSEPGIIMANHRSYFDVAIVRSLNPCVFVAKSSVRSWPIIGFGADAMRTVWVNRNSKESRQKTRAQLKQRLEEGLSVILFPEGTTTIGPDIAPYKPGMFFTVAEGEFNLYAVAIEYEDPSIAWVDKDLFVPHFFKIFGKKKIRVKVAFSQTMRNSDGEMLREEVETWTRNKVLEFRNQWDS